MKSAEYEYTRDEAMELLSGKYQLQRELSRFSESMGIAIAKALRDAGAENPSACFEVSFSRYLQRCWSAHGFVAIGSDCYRMHASACSLSGVVKAIQRRLTKSGNPIFEKASGLIELKESAK